MTDIEKILERAGSELNSMDHEETARLMPIIRALCDVIEMQREALKRIEYDLEGYPNGQCDACTYNLANIRPEAEEALAETDKRLAELAQEK